MAKKKGFTLVEMLIVVSILGLLLPAFFAIVYGLFRQQIQLINLQKVKEGGDFSRRIITNTIRNNAVEIISDCSGASLPATTTKICFKDGAGYLFGYFITSEATPRLASYSAVLVDPVYLVDTTSSFPMVIPETPPAVFSKIDSNTVQFVYDIQSVPKVDYLVPQKMSYQFYVNLHK